MNQSDNGLPKRILLVDDDASSAAVIEEALARRQIAIDKATALDTALYYFHQSRYDVVLVSIDFKPLPGLVLVQRWRNHEMLDRRCVAFVMVTGNKMVDSNFGLMQELGDLELLYKPFSVIQLLPYLQRGMATRRRLLAFQELKTKILHFYDKTNDLDKSIDAVKKKLPELGNQGISVLYGLYERAGRFEDALSLIKPLLEKDSKNASLMNAKATMLMRLQRFEEAKPILEQLDGVAPQNMSRIEQLTDAYLELNEPDNSVKKMREMIDLNPDQPNLKFDMFSKLYDRGYDSHAIALGKDTTTPMEIVRFYNNKGVMLAKDSQEVKALQEYERALKFYPNFKKNYLLYFNIALAHLHMKTAEGYQAALKNLKICLQLEPDFDKAKHALEHLEKAMQAQKVG